ncbi:hypothetical protein CBR_g22272 [Chara braunii]|uniref:MBD domain-containing protein n=1 Tax=Chara braunii TaxID=69332 RepID=A0A388L2H3_CHABU|nr:hypothetical protein CBR_g22272 [Chara braunii]|eukprot:GBG76524.1 hypothetical protein CBR_g22272 [Chara braunii]
MSGIVTDSVPGVPEGWRRRVCKRGNRNHVDVYFYGPDGVVVRSKKHLKEYLEKHQSGLSFDAFDWTGQHGLPVSPERFLLQASAQKRSARKTSADKEEQPSEKKRKRGRPRKSEVGVARVVDVEGGPSSGVAQRKGETLGSMGYAGGSEERVQVGAENGELVDLREAEPEPETVKAEEEDEMESTNLNTLSVQLQQPLENGRKAGLAESIPAEEAVEDLTPGILHGGNVPNAQLEKQPKRPRGRPRKIKVAKEGKDDGGSRNTVVQKEGDGVVERAQKGVENRNWENSAVTRGGVEGTTPAAEGNEEEEETLFNVGNAANDGGRSVPEPMQSMGTARSISSGDASEISIALNEKVCDDQSAGQTGRNKRRKVDSRARKRSKQDVDQGTPKQSQISDNSKSGDDERLAVVVLMPGVKGNNKGTEASEGEAEGFRIQDVIKLCRRSSAKMRGTTKEDFPNGGEMREKAKGEMDGEGEGDGDVALNIAPSEVDGNPTSSTQEEEDKPAKGLCLADDEGHRRTLAALHLSSMPSEILCRDRERREVLEMCKHAVQQQKATAMYICGCPGTGKTLTMEELKKNVPQWALQAAVAPPTVVMMNCMCAVEPKQIFQRILSCLSTGKTNVSISAVSIAAQNALAELTRIVATPTKVDRKQDGMALLILDEIDHLMTKDQSVLYELFRLTTLPESRCILVGIANSIDMTQRLLPHLRAFSCIPSVVTFPAYNQSQICAILNQRLKQLSFQAFHPLAIELCARKVAAAFGDMRKALDVCRLAVDVFLSEVKATRGTTDYDLTNSDEEDESLPVGRTKTAGKTGAVDSGLAKEVVDKPPTVVLMRHMVKALAKSFHLPLVETLQALPQHQQMILCSAVRLFRARKKDATLGELNKAYIEQCKSASINALTSAEFTCMCTVLADQAILNIGPGRDERLRRVTLRVQEEDVRFALEGVRFFRTILSEDDSKEVLSDR